jgi:hypothetical protein
MMAMRIDKSTNPFLTTEEMQEHFPQHFKTLKDHLDDPINKREIFDRMVRKNGPQGGDYDRGDPSPVNKHLSFIKDGKENWNGVAQVRDMSDNKVDEAMKKLKWFFKENKIYLNDSEEDDVARRLLELHPIDLAGSNWALQPNGNDAAPARKIGSPGNWQEESVGKGKINPGHMKASMTADKEILDKYFPVEWERRMTDRGSQVSPTFERISDEPDQSDLDSIPF